MSFHSESPDWSLAMRHGTTARQSAPTRARAPADRLTAMVNLRGLLGRRLQLPVTPRVNNHHRVKQTAPLKSTRGACLVGISSTTSRAVRYAVGLHVRRVGRDACRSPVTSMSTRRDQKALIPFQASPQTSDPTARRSHLTSEGSARDDDRNCGISGRSPAHARRSSESALGVCSIRFCGNVWLKVGLA